MRKLDRFALMTFVALAGMAGLSACSSSDDAGDEPSVNPGEAVKTSFTLSVGLPKGNTSASAKAATRVSDDVAQVNSNFRGIDNINLIPFNTEITASATPNATRIVLPNTTNNTLTTTGSVTTTNGNARVYNDVSINVGTNHFLFYGKAIDGDNATSSIEKPSAPFTYGYLNVQGLDATTAAAPSTISFTPATIYRGEVNTETKATALVAYLNSIAGTTYTPTSGTTTSSWSAYAAADENKDRPLTTLYTCFVSLKAGSSNSIEKTVQELYTSLENLSTEAGGNNLTADEAALRNAIVAKITDATYVSNGTDANANTTLAFQDNIKGFPENLDLPDGAVALTFNNNQFAMATSASTTLDNGIQMPALSSYAYPANLWYFANTAINTSARALSDQYTDGRSWDDILNNYDEKNSSVNATTRSIALVNQIQYAVGRLLTNVKAGAATLYDRNGASVTVGANTFPVSAIIVGGQRKVDWQFQPGTLPNTDTQYAMYDKVADNTIYASTNNSVANNTLVLETPASEGVNIAVELTNNSGKQFQGYDGVVPAGGKFYLIARLAPSAATGNTTNLNQVFKQDYITTANLTIAVNGDSNDRNHGLGNAYTVIPDLRTPVLSIGMSVNLEWQSGLTFNVDM